MEKVNFKLAELVKDCEARIFEGKNKRIRIIPGTLPNGSTKMMVSEFKTELEKKGIPLYISEGDSPKQKEDYEINFEIIEWAY